MRKACKYEESFGFSVVVAVVSMDSFGGAARAQISCGHMAS